MPKRSGMFFPNLIACLILAWAPFISQTWFFIPAAVSLLVHSRHKILILVPLVAFAMTVYSLSYGGLVGAELDFLSIYLLFAMGVVLRWAIRSKASMTKILVLPGAFAFVLGLLSFLSRGIWGFKLSYLEWVNRQIGSEVLPYLFKAEGWPESVVELYNKIFMPALQQGLLSWFAAIMATSFFVNGIVENFLRNLGERKKTLTPKGWHGFATWKTPDWVLMGLVLGLAAFAVPKLFHIDLGSLVSFAGWNLLIISLLMVFFQGVALATYFIPRSNFLGFAIIFIVLIFDPIPVLMLAGLADLWFDFRSKTSSEPKSG